MGDSGWYIAHTVGSEEILGFNASRSKTPPSCGWMLCSANRKCARAALELEASECGFATSAFFSQDATQGILGHEPENSNGSCPEMENVKTPHEENEEVEERDENEENEGVAAAEEARIRTEEETGAAALEADLGR